MGIELSLIRTLQLLQSCPNLVTVQAWNIIEFHCVICNSEPRVSSYTVNSHFRWSNPLFLLLLGASSQASCSPVADQGFIFSFGSYSRGYGRFIASLRLHQSVCTWMREERTQKLFHAGFETVLFHHHVSHLQSYSSTQLMGSITLSF